MKTYTLIGLAGKKQSGKDSFCAALAKHAPVKRIALADPLKDEVYNYVLKPFDIDRRALDDDRKENFRLILQGWGTDFRRKMFGNDYWVQKLIERLDSEEFKSFQGFIVIRDIRFEDEAKFVDQNGILIRINRANYSLEDTHSSEKALDHYHFPVVVENDGTLADLDDKAKEFLEQLEK